MAKLTFYGAAKEVTGSCYLLETRHSRILMECGMHQGGNAAERRNDEPFPFDPRSIDAVVLSHAHMDHSGLLPKLVKEGFHGPIYATDATRRLLAIMLRDGANLYLRDLENHNRRLQRAGKKLLHPRYGLEDVNKALRLCVSVGYHREESIGEDITFQFHNAGHILGSAIVELNIQEGGDEKPKKIVFSGDLGNPDSVLMPTWDTLTDADLVLLESTYGDRDHRQIGATKDELAEVLNQACKEGGNVMIPAFAVGRAQELLYYLAMLNEEGRLRQPHIFLDSPMAIEVTEVYRDYMSLLDQNDIQRILKKSPNGKSRFLPRQLLPQLRATPTVEESMMINRFPRESIVIAGSGMCNGGRIVHHLKYNLWRRESHVVFVGFQAQGTLGRLLVDGAERVKIFGQEVVVNAKIHTLGGFSAHAGQSQLVEWMSHFQKPVRVCLVHGEEHAQIALQSVLKERLALNAEIHAEGDSITL
ncbi:Metallo-beta-lactamase superfamily protein [gamma proteobacterium HdN1]|nr:Metallo-beta-lactamase superfamily protein [gamma proteobacterium HdN1]